MYRIITSISQTEGSIMGHCILVITKKLQKRIEWIRLKAQTVDDIYRVEFIKWQKVGHLV